MIMTIRFQTYLISILAVLGFFISCKKTDYPDTVTPELPVLKTDTNEITLYKKPNTNIRLFVEPSMSIDWKAGGTPDWIAVSPESGKLNSETIVNITIDSSKVIKDYVNFKLFFTSDNANNTSVNIHYYPYYYSDIKYDYQPIFFYYSEDSIQRHINNAGLIDHSWILQSCPDYIKVTPSSGVLESGTSMDLNFEVIRSNLGGGTFKSTIVLKDEIGGICNIPVTVMNYVEEKWLFKQKLIDAAFNTNDESIVVITKSPNSIFCIYPLDSVYTETPLLHNGKTLAISPAGDKAVVGCDDGSVLIFSLPDLSLLYEYTIDEFDFYDIVIGLNDKAYFTIADGSYLNDSLIYTLDINTGIYKGYIKNSSTELKLAINNDFTSIYGIGYNTKYRFYILPNSVELAYKKNKIGPGNDRIFFNEAGDKLFFKRSSFHLSDNISFDFELIGSYMLSTGESLNFLNICSESRTIVAKSYHSYTNYISLIDEDNFVETGQKKCPGFYNPETFEHNEGHCYYAFFNNNGDKVFALIVPSPLSYLNEWGLATYDINSFK